MLTLSTAHTGMEASPTVAWLAILMPESLPTPPLTSAMPPVTESPMLPTALESPELPPLPSLLPPDCTPEPEDTLLTLPVLSMLPRGPLMLSPRLMLMPLFCMELMDTVVLATPDMAMVPTPMEDMPMVATPMPMELTTERGLLMLSPRLMPMLLFCMELMDTVVLATPDMAMVPTPMEDMPMVAT